VEKISIRSVAFNDFLQAVDWAASEGWNPGIEDLEAFYATDPTGFLMGFQGKDPVSSISVVKYGENYGFLGFYIVRPDLRGTGAGIATWNAGLQYLEGRTVGLDGVVDQQDNYRKSGFKYVGPNIRYSGVPVEITDQKTSIKVEDVGLSSAADIIEYDRAFFPAPRDTFINHWLQPGRQNTRLAKYVRIKGEIVGYGVIRKCRSGYKVGPLFSENVEIANALFTSLVNSVEAGSEVDLDVPGENEQAVSLAQKYGLRPSFETARMYKGEIPNLPQNRVFGVTTFELG